MRNIRADLIERLNATVEQRAELSKQLRVLEARERCLRALVSDEERSAKHVAALAAIQPRIRGGSATRICPRLISRRSRLESLEQLKQHACGLGLATRGASGRVLNIALVNLLRQGSVVRLPNGRWRLRDQGTQLPLDLAPQRLDTGPDSAVPGTKVAS